MVNSVVNSVENKGQYKVQERNNSKQVQVQNFPFMITGLCLGLLGTVAMAADNGWQGKGEGGLVMVEGNTKSEVLNLAADLSRKSEKWENGLKLGATTASNEGDTTAESYFAQWITQYDVSERGYLFGDIRYFDDNFDSFDGIVTYSSGYGYRVFDSEELQWKLTGGLGFRQTTVDAPGDSDDGDSESGVAFIGTSDVRHQLTETASVEDALRVEATADNTFVQNKLSLSVAMSTSLALKLAYDIRYNSKPASGFESTDTITSVNMVYNF